MNRRDFPNNDARPEAFADYAKQLATKKGLTLDQAIRIIAIHQMMDLESSIDHLGIYINGLDLSSVA